MTLQPSVLRLRGNEPFTPTVLSTAAMCYPYRDEPGESIRPQPRTECSLHTRRNHSHSPKPRCKGTDPPLPCCLDCANSTTSRGRVAGHGVGMCTNIGGAPEACSRPSSTYSVVPRLVRAIQASGCVRIAVVSPIRPSQSLFENALSALRSGPARVHPHHFLSPARIFCWQ